MTATKSQMEHLTYIQISKTRAKYNDVLRKGLLKLNIAFEEKSTKYSKQIFVNKSDIEKAQRFLLSISLTNPKYI